MTEIVLNSVITGIHKTKMGAHRDVRLLVENDDGIQHIDPDTPTYVSLIFPQEHAVK